MQTIAERIMLLVDRLENGNKSEFARKVGVTPAYISKLGKNPDSVPTGRVMSDICSAYNVNFEWLTTGAEPMIPPASREDEIADIVKAAVRHDPEKASKFFQDLFGSMSDGEIVLMYQIFRNHFPE